MEPSFLESRVVADLEIKCPAGTPIAETISGSGCWCRVTSSPLTTGADPRGLEAFCTNADGYRACNVWQADKRAIETGSKRYARRA